MVKQSSDRIVSIVGDVKCTGRTCRSCISCPLHNSNHHCQNRAVYKHVTMS
jgi:hypothetical protein